MKINLKNADPKLDPQGPPIDDVDPNKLAEEKETSEVQVPLSDLAALKPNLIEGPVTIVSQDGVDKHLLDGGSAVYYSVGDIKMLQVSKPDGSVSIHPGSYYPDIYSYLTPMGYDMESTVGTTVENYSFFIPWTPFAQMLSANDPNA